MAMVVSLSGGCSAAGVDGEPESIAIRSYTGPAEGGRFLFDEKSMGVNGGVSAGLDTARSVLVLTT